MPNQHRYPPVRLRADVYDALSYPNSSSASKSLERYFWLLKSALPELSEAEFNLICDACNGWLSSGEPPELAARGLALQVEDAIAYSGLDKKWGVDGAALVAKLQSLSPLASLAIVEKVERFWEWDND